MAFFDEQTGGLIVHWKTVTAITDLVGSGTAAKIWPHAAKQGTIPPYIVFVRADGRPYIHLGGTSGARLTVLHVYCYGTTAAQADTLANAVKTNTETMRGSYSGTTVNRVEVENIDDGFEFRQTASDQKDFWVRLVIRMVHSE